MFVRKDRNRYVNYVPPSGWPDWAWLRFGSCFNIWLFVLNLGYFFSRKRLCVKLNKIVFGYILVDYSYTILSRKHLVTLTAILFVSGSLILVGEIEKVARSPFLLKLSRDLSTWWDWTDLQKNPESFAQLLI
jgi:hypothetical protein